MKKFISSLLIILLIFMFWKCPFEFTFGIPCPGCMMTTAAYYLIQLDFKKAYFFNPVIYLLVIMLIPLLYTYKRNQALFSKLLSFTLIVWLIIYIYRMMTIFPNYPMSFVEENIMNYLK